MILLEGYIDIQNRQVLNSKDFVANLKRLPDGRHLYLIQDFRKRSLDQNNYYWAVVVPMCRIALYHAGWDELRTNADTHEFLLSNIAKRDITNIQTGQTMQIVQRSSAMSVSDFSEYIEAICKWAAEYLGIYIPSPNEARLDLRAWEKMIIANAR